MDMIKKIHKIPDKVFFNAVFLIVVLWNLKYFFLPLQVPFTMIAKDFIWHNQFYSTVEAIKTASLKTEGFQDEGEIGFVSDIAQNSVFDLVDTIKSYYIAQYAIVPSVLKNDLKHKYIIADFEKKKTIPDGFLIEQKINENIYILKRNDK